MTIFTGVRRRVTAPTTSPSPVPTVQLTVQTERKCDDLVAPKPLWNAPCAPTAPGSFELITRRSQVRILPPLLRKAPLKAGFVSALCSPRASWAQFGPRSFSNCGGAQALDDPGLPRPPAPPRRALLRRPTDRPIDVDRITGYLKAKRGEGLASKTVQKATGACPARPPSPSAAPWKRDLSYAETVWDALSPEKRNVATTRARRRSRRLPTRPTRAEHLVCGRARNRGVSALDADAPGVGQSCWCMDKRWHSWPLEVARAATHEPSYVSPLRLCAE